MDTKTKLRAVLYLRVSDPSQIENNSLETQEKVCLKYADSQGYVVSKVFRDEGFSAKHVHSRPALKDLLNYCSKKENIISAVIVYKVDRWTRNTEEGLGASALLANKGVQLISATENIEETPTGQFMKTILMALGQLDNELKGERVKDNMKSMFHSGLWCWKLPIGYVRPKGDKESRKGLAPLHDKNLAPIISKMFENASTGLYSRNQLADQMNLRGYADHYGTPANAKTIINIVSKTFYFGLMYADKWGEYAQGLHKPMTDEITWRKANFNVLGKSRKYKIQDNHLYPLKGLLLCELCGRSMTSSNPKGRTKNYLHYECGNDKCRKVRINIENCHSQFMNILVNLKLSDRVLKIFEYMVFSEWDKNIEMSRKESEKMSARIVFLENELRRISKSYDVGIYTTEEAREEADRVRNEITVLKIERSDTNIDQYNSEKVRNFTEHFLKNFDHLWKQLDLPKKQVLQNKMFPEGIICTPDKKIRTVSLSPSFELIEALNSEKSSLVTPPGVEPGFPG